MKFEFIVAWRLSFSKSEETKRSRFFRSFAIYGVALSVSILIIGFSIGLSFKKAIEEKLIQMVAHINIISIFQEPFLQDAAVAQEITALDNVKSVEPIWEQEIILKLLESRSKDFIEPAVIKGVNSSPFIQKNIVEGQFLRDQESKNEELEIVLGKRLSEKLNVKIDSKLLLLTPNKMYSNNDNTILPKDIKNFFQNLKIIRAKVIGIFETGLSDGFDDRLVLAKLQDIQSSKLFNESSMITGYEVRVQDKSKLYETLNIIQNILGTSYIANTLYELYSGIFSWLKLQQNITPLILTILVIVASFNIFSLLMITVLIRRKAIGVLAALGASASQLKRIFILQAFIISSVATLAGNIVALILIWIQKEFQLLKLKQEVYLLDVVPIDVYPEFFLWSSLGAIAICTLAASIPARIAAKLSPARVLQI